MQVKIGSYNHPPWGDFLKIYQWKVKFISEKLGNARANFLCAKLIEYLHYYSVFNDMITQDFHPQRLTGRFKLSISRIRLTGWRNNWLWEKDIMEQVGNGLDAVVVLCLGQSGRLCRVGTITLNPAKHTALGHALRKENSLDKSYYILCVCSSLCLKKTSNYFICSQREKKKKKGRSGRWGYVKGQLRRNTEQSVSPAPAHRSKYSLMVFWDVKIHIMAIPGTSSGLLRLVWVNLFFLNPTI